MLVKVRAFAGLREALGFSQTEVEAPSGARVSDVVALVAAQRPAARLTERRFSTVVNRSVVKADHALNEGDELSLFPPVSGG